jgi:hypothetical protein
MRARAARERAPLITFWRAVFVAIMALGAYATYVRFARGLGTRQICRTPFRGACGSASTCWSGSAWPLADS